MSMDKLSSNDIKVLLGKESILNPKRLVNKLNYVSGILPFDQLLNGKLFTEVTALINIKYRPKGLQVEIMKGLKYHSIGILEEDIFSINLNDRDQIYKQKEKSVIGRALIGGLILGPVGAIIGGMTGVGNKQVEAKMPELVLSISFKELGERKIMLFSCEYKNRKVIEAFFKKNYEIMFQLNKIGNE